MRNRQICGRICWNDHLWMKSMVIRQWKGWLANLGFHGGSRTICIMLNFITWWYNRIDLQSSVCYIGDWNAWNPCIDPIHILENLVHKITYLIEFETPKSYDKFDAQHLLRPVEIVYMCRTFLSATSHAFKG